MYFVAIDLARLATRLLRSFSFGCPDVHSWLFEQGFTPVDGGWMASSQGMNRLHCSEILYSERRPFVLPRKFESMPLAN